MVEWLSCYFKDVLVITLYSNLQLYGGGDWVSPNRRHIFIIVFGKTLPIAIAAPSISDQSQAKPALGKSWRMKYIGSAVACGSSIAVSCCAVDFKPIADISCSWEILANEILRFWLRCPAARQSSQYFTIFSLIL